MSTFTISLQFNTDRQGYHTILISKICSLLTLKYYVLENITVLISKKRPYL